MRVALSKVLRAHVEMLKCKQIITPEEYRIRFRVLYLIPHELTGFFLKSRRRQSFSVVNTYRMALRPGHVSDAFGIEARSGPTRRHENGSDMFIWTLHPKYISDSQVSRQVCLRIL